MHRTLQDLHRHARAILADAALPEGALDARLIVEAVTGTDRLALVRDAGRIVTTAELQATDAALARRLAGEPVHRILGWREFHGLRLMLGPETLEPRDDTEALVGLVLAFLTGKQGSEILDLGTGTGAIALALLSELPTATATGTDVSAEALQTAGANAEALGFGRRFKTMRSDWFGAIEGRYDAIVSNPPYIPSDDIAGLAAEVRDHDPRRALDGGVDGLDAYRRIAGGSGALLKPGGRVFVEIGSNQRDEVADLFVAAGFELQRSADDLGGITRALEFSWQGS